MIQLPTGGVLATQVHTQKTGLTLAVGLQIVRTPPRNRPGGFTMRYPWKITHGLTKMAIRRGELQPWRCSARWSLPIFSWFWVENRYLALGLGLASSLTIKVTFSPFWTRRRSICQLQLSSCNSLSWSMLLGSNWRLRTWRGITINGQMNLPILTSLDFDLTGDYQWEKLFPILNFCGLFWMTRWLPLNLRVTILNVVRPTIMPPKVHWSQVAAADFLLTVVISILTTLVCFSFARAQRSGGLGGLDVWHHHCISGSQMKPVLWWMRLASDRNPAAQANCIAKVLIARCSCLYFVSDIFNSIREHIYIQIYTSNPNIAIYKESMI